MIVLITHKDSQRDTAYFNEKKIELKAGSTFDHLQDLAHKYPEEWIGWSTTNRPLSDWNALLERATIPYMVLSQGVAPTFLSQVIDYVEDSPFINFKKDQWYPTWMMSDELGLIHASVLQKTLSFKTTGKWIYDLNFFTKIMGSQGLFCYSRFISSEPVLNNTDSYSFVAQTQKKRWVFFLLLCHIWYEKRFPFYAFAQALFKKQYSFTIDLESIQRNVMSAPVEKEYDVIIPTMGRAAYLKNVLLDLEQQTLKPKKVIIIEQNGDSSSSSDLNYLNSLSWSFKILHEFIHQTGACNARNMALEKTMAPWVLLFDDDNRFGEQLMDSVFESLSHTKSKALTIAYLQKGEVETQKTFKQWPFFGSGCSIVHRDVIEKCSFDMALEHGYGEDVDYGMQIRNAGYDVIYAPQIQILHLKAPIGGFRKPHVFPWNDEEIQPKPSPQIMYHRKKNYTDKQLKGYKLILFFKFYKDYHIKNPISYIKYFRKAWRKSMDYTLNLEKVS